MGSIPACSMGSGHVEDPRAGDSQLQLLADRIRGNAWARLAHTEEDFSHCKILWSPGAHMQTGCQREGTLLLSERMECLMKRIEFRRFLVALNSK